MTEEEQFATDVTHMTMAIHAVTSGRSVAVVLGAIGNCLMGAAVGMPHMRESIAELLRDLAARTEALGDASPEEANRMAGGVTVGPDGKPVAEAANDVPAGTILQ